MSDLQQQELNHLVDQFFPCQSAAITQMMADVDALYQGRWPQFQACQVDYHNIDHVQAVLLAALRITAGYGLATGLCVDTETVLVLVAAALFHDSGYLKSRDEQGGRGGQYTFEHVQRSQRVALDYLQQRSSWTDEQRHGVVAVISATEIISIQDAIVDVAPCYRLLAQILASADLLAQVADEHYVERLPQLFSEFEEAYEYCGRKQLKARGIHVFTSLDALLAGSAKFIRQQVVPRLQALGGMEEYLRVFYAQPLSPYQQRLQDNLHRFESFEC